MKLDPIQVECYAGFRADETPLRFTDRDKVVEIGQVLDRWYRREHT